MTDREMVINGLEHCKQGPIGCQNGCPYTRDFGCRSQLTADALELLKEQEARILTQDEIIDYNGYIWKEYKETSIMTVSEIKIGIERVPYNGNCEVKEMNWATYKKLWRCWTEKPTEEQRKAVKWDD